MNLNEIPAWSEVEKQSWFADLTPEEKTESLTKWKGDMMQFAKDPREKFAIAATAKAKARSFLGEEMPDDPIVDAIKRRQADIEDIGSRYDAFAKGQVEEPDQDVLTLNDTLKGNTPYSVVGGRLFVSPSLVWDRAAYEKAVNEAPVDEDEKILTLESYDGAKERASESLVNNLGYTDEAFREFAAEGFGKGKSNTQIVEEWKAQNKIPDSLLGTVQGVGRQAYFGLRSGLSGLERSLGGLGAFFGSEDSQKYAEESGKESASYMARRLGEGPEFVGELTSGATSIIPTIAAGAAMTLFTEGAGAPAAASIIAGALQSAGSAQADSYEFYREQGRSHADALADSRVDGLVSGIITGAVTKYAGLLGSKLGIGQGIEGLFSGPVGRFASKITQKELSVALKEGAKTVGGSALQEGFEEGADQLAQGIYERVQRDPTKTLPEIMAETLAAAKVGAVLGGAAEGAKLGISRVLNRAKFAVPATEDEEALRAKFEVPVAAEAEVEATPEVQQATEAIKTAVEVADEVASDAPATAEALKAIAAETADETAGFVAGATQNLTEATIALQKEDEQNNQTPLQQVESSGPVMPESREMPVLPEQPEAQAPETRADLSGIQPQPVASFQTSKGSTYDLLPDGTTIRNKAARPEHPGEEGLQPRSSKTLFVTEEGADALGIVQTEGLPFEIRQRKDGTWGAVALEGPAKGKFYKTSLTAASENPAVGLIPVEIWNRSGKKQAVHFGNKITSVSVQQPPQGQPVETQTDALPIRPTTQSVPSQERPEVGLQQVGEGNTQPEIAAKTGKAGEEVAAPQVAGRGTETGAPKLDPKNDYFASNLAFRAWRIASGMRWDDNTGDWVHPNYPNRSRSVVEVEIAESNPPKKTDVQRVFNELAKSYGREDLVEGEKTKRQDAQDFIQVGRFVRVGYRVPVYEKGEVVGGKTNKVVGRITRILPDGKVEVRLNQGGFKVLPPNEIEDAPTHVGNKPLPNEATEGTVTPEDEAEVALPENKPASPSPETVPTATLPDGQVTPGGVAEPSEAAPEPAKPASPQVQSFRDAVSQMSPTAQAKWTPELRATAEAWLDSGGTTGLDGLSETQIKVVGRYLPDEVKVAFEKEQARKTAQRNKLPDHRESSLPPIPSRKTRKLGAKGMEFADAALNEITKVIPNVRNLVEVRNSEEGEPDAEGFYDPQTDKTVVLANNVFLKDHHAGNEAMAMRETIVHELLHRGFAKLRQTNPQLFEQFEKFSITDTNDNLLDSLVRRGYSMYANWRNDPVQAQKAREEVFVRKAALDLAVNGLDAIKSPTSLASQFFKWFKEFLSKLLGRIPSQDQLVHWTQVFLNAAQADFIEKTPGERMHAFTAYHGTPHKVDKFTTAKIGTGEGAQAYGWGLYFAENKGVAESYQKGLTEKDFIRKVREVFSDYDSPDEAIRALNELDLSEGQRRLVEALREEDWWGFDYPHQAVQSALREPQNFDPGPAVLDALKSFGNLYTVELLPDADEFLDWDKPLSEQSEKVKAAIRNLLNVPEVTVDQRNDPLNGNPWVARFSGSNVAIHPDRETAIKLGNDEALNLYARTGSEAYRAIDPDEKAASQKLASLGIPGIRYLDGGSRGAGEGTHNYVIFDENLVRILEENGVPLVQPESTDIRYALGEPDQSAMDVIREKLNTFIDENKATNSFLEAFGPVRVEKMQQQGEKLGPEYIVAQVRPLMQRAQSELGFELDEEGNYVLSQRATDKAQSVLAQWLQDGRKFAKSYNKKAEKFFDKLFPGMEEIPVDSDMASAVLLHEIISYAKALAASSPKAEDQILLDMVRPQYGSVVLANYDLTMHKTGRTLQTGRNYSEGPELGQDAVERSNQEGEKKAKEDFGPEAVSASTEEGKVGVEAGVDAAPDLPAVDPTLRLLDLAVESLDDVAKADANAVFDVLLRLGEAEEALERAEKVGNKAMSILTERRTAQELPSTVAELKVLVGKLRVEAAEKLAKLRGSLEGAKPETRKKVKERAKKAGGSAKTKPTEPDKEDDPITKEIKELSASLGTLSKLEGFAVGVVKELAKKLVAKFQPAKVEALRKKIEDIVYKFIRNENRLGLEDFSEQMTKYLAGIGIDKPALQEALVAKAWAYHFAAPTKAVQALAAKMKSAEKTDKKGPESVANVRKAVNAAVASGEERRGVFVKQLSDKLVALGVEFGTAQDAAKAAFEFAAKQADKKAERILETLRQGKLRALLRTFEKTEEKDRDEAWQSKTLKSVFVEAGLGEKAATRATEKAMLEAEAIFGIAGVKVAEIKQQRVQKFLDSLASTDEETNTSEAKRETLRSVFKEATLDDTFDEEALLERFQSFGASESQAQTLVEKVAEIREGNKEALAEAKRQQVNQVIEQTNKRIAQLETGTAARKTAKEETLRRAVGEAVKAKEFDEAALKAKLEGFGATSDQANTLVKNVKTLRELGESKTPSKSKLRKFLLSHPQETLYNPEQRQALVKAFLRSEIGMSEPEIARYLPKFEKNFDKAMREAREKYLDELEAKFNVPKKERESRVDAKNRKLLQALRAGLAETKSPKVALLEKLGFKEFNPTDKHVIAKLDAARNEALANGEFAKARLKQTELTSLLLRRRPPMGWGQLLNQAWITSALSSFRNLALNIWTPFGEALSRYFGALAGALRTGDFTTVSALTKALGEAFRRVPARFKFAYSANTFTQQANAAIAEQASLIDEFRRSLSQLRDKKLNKKDRAKALARVVFSFGDYSRRLLQSIDESWFSLLESFISSANLTADINKYGIKAQALTDASVRFATQAKNDAFAADQIVNRLSEYLDSLKGKTTVEIQQALELYRMDQLGISPENLAFTNEMLDVIEQLRLRSGAEGDALLKAAKRNINDYRRLAWVRAAEKADADTREWVSALLTGKGATKEEVDRVLKDATEGSEKAASYGMGLHRVEEAPALDIGNTFAKMIEAMGQQAIRINPLIGRMMVGFFGIPVNLMNKSLWYAPIYGPVRYHLLAKWKERHPDKDYYAYSLANEKERAQRFREVWFGQAVFGLLAALGAFDDRDEEETEGLYVTLGGPANRTEKDAWLARGFRPYSIAYKFEDGSVTSIPYGVGAGEFLKMPLMAAGAFDDMRLNKKLGNREDLSSALEYFNAFAAGVGRQATFLGAKNTVGAVLPDTFGSGTVANVAFAAGNFFPFNGLDRSLETLASGPPDRSRTGAILANIPYLRHFGALGARPATNVFGDPWGSKTDDPIEIMEDRLLNQSITVWNTSKPLTGQDKKLYEFIGRYQIGPNGPQRGALELRNGYLTDQEWADYREVWAANAKREWFSSLDRMAGMDEDGRAKAAAELSTKASRKAKSRFNYE